MVLSGSSEVSGRKLVLSGSSEVPEEAETKRCETEGTHVLSPAVARLTPVYHIGHAVFNTTSTDAACATFASYVGRIMAINVANRSGIKAQKSESFFIRNACYITNTGIQMLNRVGNVLHV